MKKKTTFFETMKKWRNIAGLSQEKAAEEIGVSRNTIQYWEGKGRPTIPKKEHFEKIIKAYKIDRDVFMKEIAKAISPTLDTVDIPKEIPNSTSALAQLIATTFYTLSSDGFNPVKTNVYIPPTRMPITAWLDMVHESLCDTYSLDNNAKLILGKAVQIVMSVLGVIEMNSNGTLYETQDARKKMQNVTLTKTYQIISAMKAERRPGMSIGGRGGLDNHSNIANMQWFIDGYNKLKDFDVQNGWTPPRTKGNRPYVGPSPTQAYIDMQFETNSQRVRETIDEVLLSLQPFFCSPAKEMFCCEEEGTWTNIEDFINGKSMIVLDENLLKAPEKKFFCQLISHGIFSHKAINIDFGSQQEQDEIIRLAKEEILALAANTANKEKAICKNEGNAFAQIEEQKMRINALTECLAETMKKCQLSSLFESAPNNTMDYKKEIEKITTEDMSSGKEFRIKFASALIKFASALVSSKTNHQTYKETVEMPQNYQTKETTIKEKYSYEPSEDELLSEAYKEFIRKQPEKGITMETENFINKINEDVKAHIGTRIFQILNLDAKALETEEGITKLTNWADSIKKVVAYIGTTGNTRKALLDKELSGSIDANIMKSIFQTCEATGLLVKSASNGTGKGRPSPNYVLTYLGMIYFSILSKEYTNGMPLRQARIMASSGGADEKSVEHANLIHQMEDLLEEYGYDWKDEDEQQIPGTPNSSICDILATRDGSSVRIECELGNGNPAHYKEKVKKIFAVTPYALFIAPNKDAARSLSSQINEGLGVAKSVLRNKGQLWEVVSFEDAKKRFKEDDLWPIRKINDLVAKKHQKNGLLTTVMENGTSW